MTGVDTMLLRWDGKRPFSLEIDNIAASTEALDRSKKMLRLPGRDITNLSTHASDMLVHAHLVGVLERSFEATSRKQSVRVSRLCDEYRERNDQGRRHCDRLEQLHAAEASVIAVQSFRPSWYLQIRA